MVTFLQVDRHCLASISYHVLRLLRHHYCVQKTLANYLISLPNCMCSYFKLIIVSSCSAHIGLVILLTPKIAAVPKINYRFSAMFKTLLYVYLP